MTNTFVKSSLVSAYDATPFYRPTYGSGGGRVVIQTASINPGATDATTVVYRMVRVPTSAVIHKVEVNLDLNAGTATTFTGSIGLFWSDNAAFDGTSTIKNAANAAVSASFFAYQKALASVGVVGGTGNSGGFLDVTFQNNAGNSVTDGFYTPSGSFQPLWMALTAGGYQGLDANLNAPKGPWDNNYAGLGTISSTSNDYYQVPYDLWQGFLDICFQPTTTNSLSISTMIFTMRVTATY